MAQGVWDLNSLTRDRTHVPCIGKWLLNHWTTREFPASSVLVPFLGCGTRPGMRCTNVNEMLDKGTRGRVASMCLRQGLWLNPSCRALCPCRPPGALAQRASCGAQRRPAPTEECELPPAVLPGERGRCSVVSDSATPRTIQSLEFSRPECWSGQPFPSPGNLPNPGIEPRSPTWQADSLPSEPTGEAQEYWSG